MRNDCLLSNHAGHASAEDHPCEVMKTRSEAHQKDTCRDHDVEAAHVGVRKNEVIMGPLVRPLLRTCGGKGPLDGGDGGGPRSGGPWCWRDVLGDELANEEARAERAIDGE